jgi:hypothetical protein
MVKITKTVSPARLRPWRRRVLEIPDDSAAESSPKVVVRHPFSNRRVGIEDTPSRGKFIKESLDFSIIEPAVLSVIQGIHLLVLKTYFFPVNQKYVFWYLQFCHSNCFGRKIFVLTLF